MGVGEKVLSSRHGLFVSSMNLSLVLDSAKISRDGPCKRPFGGCSSPSSNNMIFNLYVMNIYSRFVACSVRRGILIKNFSQRRSNFVERFSIVVVVNFANVNFHEISKKSTRRTFIFPSLSRNHFRCLLEPDRRETLAVRSIRQACQHGDVNCHQLTSDPRQSLQQHQAPLGYFLRLPTRNNPRPRD